MPALAPRTPSTARPAGWLAAALAASLGAAACSPSAPAAAPTPARPVDEAPPALPPVPRVTGPVEVRVVYPPANALVAARDSNFIFGSVGHGEARLTIDGTPVPVLPNGSFLAWLPVPAQPRYELAVTLDGRTTTRTHPVRLLPPVAPLPATGRLVVDSASLQPAGPVTYPADEPIRVSVRAPENATVRLVGADGRPRPLALAGGAWALELPAGQVGAGSRLEVARGADTVRLALPAVTAVPAGERRLVRLGDAAAAAAPDSGDRRIVGRPVPAGTYKWFLLPGTVLQQTARVPGWVRVRLADDLDVWVAEGDATALPAGTLAPRRVVGNGRVVPAAGWVDLRLPVADRPPYLVEEHGDRLVLTLYGTTANTDILQFVANDSLVRHVTWEQLPGGRAQYVLHLARPAFGWLALWQPGAFVLRVRRPPVPSAEAPLRGLRIAVDAGHPPAGSTGPTGLNEADATLPVARRLQAELERRGATVVMLRTTRDAVALVERPIMARRADAHALVSVHYNALPDGVNPFPAHGTGTYYFHPHSAPLARAVQGGMVRTMGLRDLGIYYDNLALVRPTWMPSVLTEGAFMMIPEQEAAARMPEFQERYARGIADGVEAYFRSLGAGGR